MIDFNKLINNIENLTKDSSSSREYLCECCNTIFKGEDLNALFKNEVINPELDPDYGNTDREGFNISCPPLEPDFNCHSEEWEGKVLCHDCITVYLCNCN